MALAGVGVGLLAFGLYLATLAPTILPYAQEMIDTPVLVVNAYVLGIPHPPGYPTYTLLTHLFTYLPVGDVAYRVNLASAVFGALAVVVVFFVGLALGGRIAGAAAGALVFGTSPMFWSQAVIAEIYTLHSLFLALVILILLVWRERRENRYLLLAAFVTGLAMTHNTTSGLLLPAGLIFVCLVEPRKLVEWRLWLKGAGLFFLGLLPYVYLPVRARMDPPINLGDPSTFGRFFDLISGQRFKGNMFVFGPGELLERFFIYLGYLVGQLHWAALAMGVVGAVYLLVRDRAGAALLGALFLGFLFFALDYDIQDYYYYFIPTYLFLCVFAAAGFGVLLKWAEGFTAQMTSPKARGVVLAALSLLILAVPLIGLGDTYRVTDQSQNYEGSRIVDVVDREVRPGAIVIQHRSPLQYMQLVEARREDIELWSLVSPVSRKEAARAYEASQQGLLYIDQPAADYKQRRYEKAGYRLVPVEEGTLYNLVPSDDATAKKLRKALKRST